MSARDELRLRVEAANRLIRASDASDPRERAWLVRSAQQFIARATTKSGSVVENARGGQHLMRYLGLDAEDERHGENDASREIA
jgi:hypothetical protein